MQREDLSGPAWARMLELPRVPVRDVDAKSIPVSPGVYAWFRSGEPIYAGNASGGGGLRDRLGKHLGVGLDLSRSSLRRNVAEYLLSVPTADSRRRPSIMTSDQVSAINAWIRDLEVSWLALPTPADAVEFERELLHECMPPLSKR